METDELLQPASEGNTEVRGRDRRSPGRFSVLTVPSQVLEESYNKPVPPRPPNLPTLWTSRLTSRLSRRTSETINT